MGTMPPLPPRMLAGMGLADDLSVKRIAPLPPGQVAGPATTRVWDEEDVPLFLRSRGIVQLQRVVTRLSRASLGQATLVLTPQQEHALPPAVRVVGKILHTLREWTGLFPPRTEAQRFGNLAFRDYGRHVEQHTHQLHRDMLPPELHPFVPELAPYLVASLGSFVRLDYGTGHELAFVAYLAFLARLGLWGDMAQESDVAVPVGEAERLVALYLVPLYLRLVWTLQDVYRLEPAGSHGAWGLDDYSFLPYILGSAQLAGQAGSFEPRHIPDGMHKPPLVAGAGGTSGPRPTVPAEELLSFVPTPTRTAEQTSAPPFANLFSTAVARIHVLKRGPFNEHSPLLWDLSGTVPTWGKMYIGMRKMWTAEVLGKLPVVQHFLFGEHAYPWPGPERQRQRQTGRAGPTHAQSHPLLPPASGPRLAAPTRPSVGTKAPWALNALPTPGRVGSTHPRLPAASSAFVGSAGPAPRPGVGSQAPWARTSASKPPDAHNAHDAHDAHDETKL